MCEKIYRLFKDVYNCETRVSVEYIFEKDMNGIVRECRKMAGRRSRTRTDAKKATKLSTRSQYYSHKIFKDNLIGVQYLDLRDKEKVKREGKWHTNPKHSVDVLQYVALSESIDHCKVSFILQVDFLKSFDFGGENDFKSVESFASTYFKPYANIISTTYLLSRSKDGKVGE